MMMIPRRNDFDLFDDMFSDPFFTGSESRVMKTDIKEKKDKYVIDTLFIDEGFGSLDTESREQAINTLSLLIDNNKLIGIISHVTELKERIDKKIIVTKTNDGSKIEIEA